MVTYCFKTTGTVSKNCRRKKCAINDAPNDEGNMQLDFKFKKISRPNSLIIKKILNVGYIIDGEHFTKEELTHMVSPSSTTKSVKDTLERKVRSPRESKMGQQSMPLSKIEELNQVNIMMSDIHFIKTFYLYYYF